MRGDIGALVSPAGSMAKVRLCGVYKTEDFDSLLFRQGSASSASYRVTISAARRQLKR
jgi:hypothetical protein